MIRFNPPPEPREFEQKGRQAGNAWLVRNPDLKKRPRDYWSSFKSYLADGFGNLCGYCAMYEPIGTVDHYLCCENHRDLAYEWSNYRYASGWINSSKSTLDEQVLDPFQVGDEWFEILLPSLQLVLTDAVPPHERQRAEFTLERLHLRDDERDWFRFQSSRTILLQQAGALADDDSLVELKAKIYQARECSEVNGEPDT